MVLQQWMKRNTQNQIDITVHLYKRDEAPWYKPTKRQLYPYLRVAYSSSKTTDTRMIGKWEEETQNRIDLAACAHTGDEIPMNYRACLLTEKLLYACLTPPTESAQQTKRWSEVEEIYWLTTTSISIFEMKYVRFIFVSYSFPITWNLPMLQSQLILEYNLQNTCVHLKTVTEQKILHFTNLNEIRWFVQGQTLLPLRGAAEELWLAQMINRWSDDPGCYHVW